MSKTPGLHLGAFAPAQDTFPRYHPLLTPRPLQALVQIASVQGGFPCLPRSQWTPKLFSPKKGLWLGSWGPGPCPTSQVEEGQPGLTLDLGPGVSCGGRQHPGYTWCRGLACLPAVGGCPALLTRLPCRWESPTSSSTYLTGADSDPHPWPEGAAAAPPAA